MENKTFNVVVNLSSIDVVVSAKNKEEAEKLALLEVDNELNVYFLKKEIAYIEELDNDGRPIEEEEQS